MNAAILFEPDGYVLKDRQIMGRRAAGAAFLRAAVEGRQGEKLWAYTPSKDSAEVFDAVVRDLDPTAETGWIPAARLDLLAEAKVLYRPDSVLGSNARMRLRAGPGRYSLCGVTHTLASAGAMDGLVDLLNAPLMPWDALICTSTVALEVLNAVSEAHAEYQRWRLRGDYRPELPQTPIIPLGVHCRDFQASQAQRAAARLAIGLEDDEVAALFAGRLSPHGKAHPYQMLHGLQAVAKATGKRLVIVQAGNFFDATLENMVRDAVAQFCPDVRSIFVDGLDEALYPASFLAADMFISLSDNIQETFGITPLEAMAAGLPVVVSDWNGYKDTVRDGVDGFRIPTWSPGPGGGPHIARDFEGLITNFDYYMSRTSTTASVDMRILVARLTDLVLDGDLRRRLGAAGQAHARALFDWSVVYRQYRELWTELDARRRREIEDPAQRAWLAAAPSANPARLDPFTAFAKYPTAHIEAGTRITLAPGGGVKRYQSLAARPVFAFWVLHPMVTAKVFAALEGAPSLTVSELMAATELDLRPAVEVVARLAKMDLVRLDATP